MIKNKSACFYPTLPVFTNITNKRLHFSNCHLCPHPPPPWFSSSPPPLPTPRRTAGLRLRLPRELPKLVALSVSLVFWNGGKGGRRRRGWGWWPRRGWGSTPRYWTTLSTGFSRLVPPSPASRCSSPRRRFGSSALRPGRSSSSSPTCLSSSLPSRFVVLIHFFFSLWLFSE